MILAQTVTGIITFYNDTYVVQGWHTTLLMIAFLVMSVFCNLYLRRILAILETIGGVTHVIFFIVSITVLTTMAERSTAKFVFTTVVSGVSGWENPGICWNLGMAPLILALVNCDGVTHMSTFPNLQCNFTTVNFTSRRNKESAKARPKDHASRRSLQRNYGLGDDHHITILYW